MPGVHQLAADTGPRHDHDYGGPAPPDGTGSTLDARATSPHTDSRARSQRRILERMSQQPDPDLREDMNAMLAAAGITVTEEGKARARAKLAEAAAQVDPEQRAALRARLGRPPATAA